MRLIKFIFIFLLALPFAAVSQNGYRYDTTLDTITNTEQDTITFAPRVTKPHTVGLSCAITELSGTSNITVYLEGSNSPAGEPFAVIAQDTVVNGVAYETTYSVVPSSSQNFIRYRYRVSGDTGTMSVQYHCVIATKEDE